MEFNSEDDAIKFYNSYAKRVGFLTRVMQRKSSEIDGRSTLGRQCHLGCNHKGLTTASGDSTKLGEMEQPEISCEASIQFKHLEKSGKWVVSRFVKDHNHPLVPVNALDNTYNVHEKAKRLHELSQELQRQEELRAAYRDSLINLLANIDKEADHFSSKVLAIVQNVRKAEAEALTLAITP